LDGLIEYKVWVGGREFTYHSTMASVDDLVYANARDNEYQTLWIEVEWSGYAESIRWDHVWRVRKAGQNLAF
jgi:hypothetical protein